MTTSAPSGRVSHGTSDARVIARPRASLIARVMPAYDVAEHHSVVVHRPTVETWDVVRHANVLDSRVVRTLLQLRALPMRLAGRTPPSGDASTLDALTSSGFVIVAEEPGREVVFGLVGPVWDPRFQPRPFDPGSFAHLPARDGVRVAFALSVADIGRGRTRVATETRVLAVDAASRRRFLRYWRLVGPFSGLIRRLMLRHIVSVAEAAAEPGS